MFSTALTHARPGLRRGFRHDPFFSFVDRFFNEGFVDETPASDLAPVDRSWLPPVDIYENENAFIATADLPGLSRDDIEVTLEDNVLTVSGERTWDNNGSEGTFWCVERAYGSFRRSFTLPAGVDASKVDASFEDGVLTLTLPKSEIAKARKITVA